MRYLIAIFLLILHGANAIIYRLNETEYSRMPDVYKFDNYDLCLSENDAMYCTLTLELVSDTPNALMDLIREYSEDTTKHYNHSILYRGICMSTTCKKYNNTNIKESAEACLNDSLWKDYELKSKVGRIKCFTSDDKADVNIGDYAFVGVIAAILLLNIIGTVYDRYSTSEKTGFSQKALMSFSIIRNWQGMLAPLPPDMDPRLKRLKAFYMVRAATAILVVGAHGLISFLVYIDNPYYVENMYYDVEKHLFINGPIVIQSFFIISGFLITYNMRIYAEKNKIRWSLFLKALVLRWMRLTPAYAIVIGFASTWARLVSSGPIWHVAVGDETYDCQRHWWKHFFYINNYFDGYKCLQQSWYLAGDMQLYILGVVVVIACKTTRARVMVLSTLAAIGLILPALQIYIQDLDAIVLNSPTAANNFYVNDMTFDNLYKRTHNNLFGFVTGLSTGYFVYYLQDINFDIQKYRKYRIFYWLLFVLGFGLVLSGSVFYQDGPRASLLVRVAYGTLVKPLFCIIAVLVIIATIFKMESLVRGLCEWGGWLIPGRLAYSVFLLHLTLIELLIGSSTTLTHVSLTKQIMYALSLSMISFLAAIPLYILVEQPFWKLSKIFYVPKTSSVNGKADIECVKENDSQSPITLKLKCHSIDK